MTPSGEDIRDERAHGVLANLPSTRPQRPSARRAAARRKSGGDTSGGTGGSVEGAARDAEGKRAANVAENPTAAAARAPAPAPARRSRKKRTPSAKAPSSRKTSAPRRSAPADPIDADPRTTPPRARRAFRDPPIPRQGFETEEEIAPGSTVRAPSGGELVTGVAELLGEVAQNGLAAGGRLLKEAFGRIPGA